MAFRLAEAYIELKARGEKELHKSLDKTKEKAKEIGPATEQAEKQVEKAAQKAAKEVAKAGDDMAEAMQKPIDKLAQFENEMKAKFAALRQRSQQLKQDLRSDGATGGRGISLGPTNPVFGRFGGAANVAAGAALVGIAKGVYDRGGEIAEGAKSETLGQTFTPIVRDVLQGMKGLGDAAKDVTVGFKDGLLGAIGLVVNALSFGSLAELGRQRRREHEWMQQDRLGRIRSYEMGREIQAVDPFRPIRDAERRSRIDNIFDRGGIGGLEAEARRLSVNAGGDLDTARQLLEVNQRIVQEKDKARRLDEAAAAAQERIISNAQQQGAAAWLQFASGRSAESISAMQQGNLGPDQMKRLDAALAERDAFRGFIQSGQDAEKFAAMTHERVMALIEEGDAVKKLRREYEALAARVAAMPAGPQRDAAQRRLDEARINIDAAEAIQSDRNAERERQQQARERARANEAAARRRERFGEGIVGGILRGVLGEFDFQQGNRPRNTASFQTVPIDQFARLIEADIAAKEEEKQRVEEAKRMHEEAQAERERIANAAEETARAVANGIAAVFG